MTGFQDEHNEEIGVFLQPLFTYKDTRFDTLFELKME